MRKDLVLILTSRCNFSCRHCLRGPATAEDLSVDLIEPFLDDMKRAGYRIIGLTGGEPAMHPGFAGVIEAIASRGLQYTFVTNGFTIDPYLEVLRRYPGSCNALAVSLDGPTEEIHNALRRKGFRQATEAVKTFAAHKLFVNVNMLVTEHNREHATEVVQLAASLGASAVWLAGIIPNPAARAPLPWEGGRREARIAARKASRQFGIPVNFACCYLRMIDIMQCANMVRPQLSMNPEGEIVFCCNTQGRGAVLGRYGEKPLQKFIADAEALGRELIDEKMRLYREKRIDEYGSNCEFCNRYLEDRIRFF